MSRVLAIVVAYEHVDALNRCIDSLNAQGYPELDYVIWDNGGCEEVEDRIRSQDGKTRIYHKSETNMMWTPAINQAIQNYATPEHEYFMTMNHDVFLPETIVANLVHAFSQLPEDAAAVGPVGHGMGGLQGATTPRGYPRERVNYLIGACVMYKMAAYRDVGSFDNNMPLGADDFDYAIRLREAGYSMWVDETDHFEHLSHVTGDSENWNEHGAASWAAFKAKYDGYFKDETEAKAALWGDARYNPSYPIGTGLTEAEKKNRGIIK